MNYESLDDTLLCVSYFKNLLLLHANSIMADSTYSLTVQWTGRTLGALSEHTQQRVVLDGLVDDVERDGGRELGLPEVAAHGARRRG